MFWIRGILTADRTLWRLGNHGKHVDINSHAQKTFFLLILIRFANNNTAKLVLSLPGSKDTKSRMYTVDFGKMTTYIYADFIYLMSLPCPASSDE